MTEFLKDILFGVICLYCFGVCQNVYAVDHYIAQEAAGNQDATSCANARAISYLAGSWSGKVSPGDTIHLCGTLTSQLVVGGSGASGNAITIKFESGAMFSQPYWSILWGIINCSGYEYIVIDGNHTGIIEATNNGSASQNEKRYGYNTGIHSTCSNIEIKNLTIRNLYVHTYQPSSGDGSVSGSAGVFLRGGNNVVVHDCNISHTTNAIDYVGGGTNHDIAFYNNTVSHSCWGIQAMGTNGGSIDNVGIHDNTIEMGYNWTSGGGFDDCHMNGSMNFSSPPNAVALTNFQFYNNYIYGSPDAPGPDACTAFIHLESLNSASTIRIFNNLLVASPHTLNHNGLIAEYGAGELTTEIYNNTFIGAGTAQGILYKTITHNGAPVIKNNIFVNVNNGIMLGQGDIPIVDHNIYYGMSYSYGVAPYPLGNHWYKVFLPAATEIKTSPGLTMGTTKTSVANKAFQYSIAGVLYSKGAVTAGTVPGNDVVPSGKYGAVAFSIDTAGTIYIKEATGNATGYDSPGAASLGLYESMPGDRIRFGSIYVMKSDGDFTFGTTDLDAANTTVIYADELPVSWQTFLGGVSPCPGSGHDCKSSTANPNLNDTTYKPTASSDNVIGTGENLTPLCSAVPSLCMDKNGVNRPSSGNWTIGAYEYISGDDTAPPAAPTGLTVN